MECEESKKVSRLQLQIKARLRSFELEFRKKHNIKKPLRYIVVTLTPPTLPDLWWHFLATRGLGIDGKIAEKLLPKMVIYKDPVIFSSTGIYQHVFGSGQFQIQHKIWRSALKQLQQMAEYAIKKSLDAMIGVDKEEQRKETRYGIELVTHLLSEVGFYPHICAIIPEYYQIKKGRKWEWKLLPEKVFREIKIQCKICEDHIIEKSLWLKDVLSVFWRQIAEFSGREQWKERYCLERVAKEYDPQIRPVAYVDIVTDRLESTINYLFSHPLTKTYRRIITDPLFTISERLKEALRSVIRFVVLPKSSPRLVKHLGFFNPRAVSPAFESLAGIRPIKDKHRRIKWRETLRATNKRADNQANNTQVLISELIDVYMDSLESGDDPKAEFVWEAITKLLFPEPSHEERLRDPNDS